MIRFYQMAISPYIGAHCRFTPTCSQYAQIAIQRYGAVKGTVLAVRRILKCHPFHKGGYDPVPPLADEDLEYSTGKTNFDTLDRRCSSRR